MDKAKILIVEDQILIAKDIKELLLSNGYRVTEVARSVDDAIMALNKNTPDLILVDIQLIGHKTGVDLANLLIDKNNIPFIFLTSVTDKTLLNLMENSRPMGFVSKPFRDIDLLTSIAIALKNFNYKKVDFHCFTEQDFSSVPFKIRKTVQYIDDNISKNITVDDLANLIGYEKNYYIKVFKKYFDDTPYQFILKRKIEKSMIMLSETKESLIEISEKLGFPNYNSFWEKFKNLNNMSPQKFRTMATQNNSDNPNV